MPVSTIIRLKVPPDSLDSFALWREKMDLAVASFPGFVSMEICPDGNQEWIIIQRFVAEKDLETWHQSPIRQRLLEEVKSIVEELQSHQVLSPFSGWFAQSTSKNPPIWKEGMLVLLVLFPIVMLEMKFLSPLTQNLNTSLATFIANTISVTLITWPTMGWAIALFGWWLNPKPHRQAHNLLGIVALIGLYLLEIACFWKLI